MKKWLIPAITVFAAIGLACSAADDATDSPNSTSDSTIVNSTGTVPSGQSVVESPLEAFEGLLSESDFAGIARLSISDAETRDFKEMAGGGDRAQVPGMDSWFGTTFESSDGAVLTFTVMEFDSAEAARSHYDLNVSDGGLVSMSDSIGDVSAEIEVNDGGIGSMLVLVAGNAFVSFHTSQPGPLAPLFSIAGIRQLAELVVPRL